MVSKMFRSVLSSLNGQGSTMTTTTTNTSSSSGPAEGKTKANNYNNKSNKLDLSSTTSLVTDAAAQANGLGSATKSLANSDDGKTPARKNISTIINEQEPLAEPLNENRVISEKPELVGRKVAQMVGKIVPPLPLVAPDLKLGPVAEEPLSAKLGEPIETDYSQTSKLVFGKDSMSTVNNNNNNNNNNNSNKNKAKTKRRLVSFVGKLHKSISSNAPPAAYNGNSSNDPDKIDSKENINAESKINLANSISNSNIATGEQAPAKKPAHSERRRSSIWNLKMVGHLTGHSNKDSSKLANKNHLGSDDDDDDDDEEYSTHKNYSKGKCILPEEDCNIPTFLETKNCNPKLINETRRILRERYAKSPENFYDHDYQRMLTDDWTVTRFLLRRRCDPKRSAKLMEECDRFRKQYKMSEVKLWEFPVEFHKAGGLFKYARDRVGNVTVYMRVKMYRRVPEISDVFKAFILCVLEEADLENEGRGTAVIFDLSSCGLQNVDLSFLSWLLSSFRNYCPKGVSYIVVYNLPWILSATCKLAMTWMSASNRRALRFVHGQEIENFISRENLPDYLNGTCPLDYRKVPEGAKPAIDVCERLDMTPEQAMKIRELFKEYIQD